MVKRKWTSFDQATTDAEFRSIPERDLVSLFDAMGNWARGIDTGWTIKSYHNGLLMIKSSNKSSGRCLFFTLEQNGTLAVALLGYKKESNDAPKHLVKTARDRMTRYQERDP